jgi:hypothetical protein
MTPPRITFDDEELTLTLTGMGGGWTFGNLREIRLADHAELHFPSSWSQFQIEASLHLVDATWQLRSDLLLRSTLQSGLTYSLANGTSGQMSADGELIEHILARPTVTIDGYINFRFNGEVTEHGFEGSAAVGVGLRGTF